MKKGIVFILMFILGVLLTTSATQAFVNTNNTVIFVDKNQETINVLDNDQYVIEEVTLPTGPVPEWDFNITGIGISEAIELNLSYLIDLVNTSQIEAYEQTVSYKDNENTVIGVDILELVDYVADAWYVGAIEVIAEDSYSKSFDAFEIQYSIYPPTSEDVNIKILLAFATNGSYLEDTDWADKAPLRMIVPSNQKYEYFNNMWVGNVTELSINDRWGCDVYVDQELQAEIYADEPSSYSDYNYTTYTLNKDNEVIEYTGITIYSIFESLDISINDINRTTFVAPDGSSEIPLSGLGGPKQAMLALKADGEYLGFNGGPYRLVGGGLNVWSWLKNVGELHIYLLNDTSLLPTEPTSLPLTIVISALSSITFAVLVIRRKK